MSIQGRGSMSLRASLVILGCLQTAIYAAVLILSRRFREEVAPVQRPILTVLALFGAAFACYLAALACLARRPSHVAGTVARPVDHPLGTVLFFAVLFRGILWWSVPIQEVDIYRYLWDGRVMAEGVDPYAYTPRQVLDVLDAGTRPRPIALAESPERPAVAMPDQPSRPTSELERLAAMARSSTTLASILRRVDHADVPTIYPPMSQLLFWAAAWWTPKDAPLAVHLGVMKGLVLVFDLGIIALLMGILQRLDLGAIWALAYAWCPLVLKESANSGHFDSLPAFFMMTAIGLSFRAGPRAPGFLCESGAALCWAAATLSKGYAALLVPILLRWWWQRLGRWSWVPVACYVSLLASAPLLVSSPNRGPWGGMREYAARWEMNDLVFLVVVENLTPPEDRASTPWFVALPARWRGEIAGRLGDSLARGPIRDILVWAGLAPARIDPPFLGAQAAVGLIYGAILAWLLVRPWRGDPRRWLLRSVFLSLAWLWFLCPAQNPWYWIWAMPLVIFQRGPWLAVSGMALLYYLRFWLAAHFPDQAVWPSPYAGEDFFTYVLVWFEHGTILAALLLGRLAKNRFAQLISKATTNYVSSTESQRRARSPLARD